MTEPKSKSRPAPGAGLSTPEPAPKPNGKPAVWDLVVADMQQRDQEGRRKYGTPLQPFNGRRALVDAYQEVLDLVVYLRQELYERDAAAASATEPPDWAQRDELGLDLSRPGAVGIKWSEKFPSPHPREVRQEVVSALSILAVRGEAHDLLRLVRIKAELRADAFNNKALRFALTGLMMALGPPVEIETTDKGPWLVLWLEGE